ncbi:hypothetical protein TSH7_02775 [Azospirillum sp. TSH7]|uniref:hypothetical protein n=1 Tax=unclassified Azospirillum TaxID=2630922 RepID=UPI000D61DF8E|nr:MULTISPECIES: hypothetical protein [unclassified Azospirillum]PWC67021.1 hypothetical protein TSH20_13435 [Azospirillum sp. TSH20]PWC68158.1 hypothetical protein TSH7_02775 [Azospirillum sp. TSH7]
MNKTPSTNIAPEHAINFFEGFAFAEDQGYSMTAHATIILNLLPNYPRAGSLADQCHFAIRITARIKKRFSDWISYYKVPNHHAFVLENPPHEIANLVKRVHVHIAFHVPDHLRERFEEVIKDAVFEGVGKRTRKRISNVVKITYHPRTWTLAAYFLKGADPATTLPGQPDVFLRHVLRVRARAVAQDPLQWAQGRIIGKRCGLSKQLDRAARAKRLQPPPLQLAA